MILAQITGQASSGLKELGAAEASGVASQAALESSRSVQIHAIEGTDTISID